MLADDTQGLNQELNFDGEIAEVKMKLGGQSRIREYLYRVKDATDERIVMEWVDRNGEYVDVVAEFRDPGLHLEFNDETFVFKRS